MASSLLPGADSSVDPEDVETDFRRIPRRTINSLSSMTDLEHDAVLSPSSDLIGGSPFRTGADNSESSSSMLAHSTQSSVQESSISNEGACFRPVINNAVPYLEGVRSTKDESVHPRFPARRYDAVIIAHPADREDAERLKEELNTLILDDGTHARVAVEDDDPNLGKTDLKTFEDWLENAEYTFLYASEKFCTECCYKEDMALTDSLFFQNGKKEYVIPLFLENKYTAVYISKSLRTVTGIDLSLRKEGSLTDRMKKKFKHNLNLAREKSRQRVINDTESKFSQMKLT